CLALDSYPLQVRAKQGSAYGRSQLGRIDGARNETTPAADMRAAFPAAMSSSFTPEITRLIDERIGWVDAELEASLGSASDLPLYEMARYHLGWRDEGL